MTSQISPAPDRGQRRAAPPAPDRGPRLTATARATEASSAGLLALFVLSLLLPVNLAFGDLRMNPSRIYLILMIIPFSLQLISGKAGRLTWVDAGMAGFVTLLGATLLYHHGSAKLPYVISQMTEIFGGYLTGRILVRSVGDYRRFIRIFLTALVILLPLALYELRTGHMVLTELFRPLVDVIKKNNEFRYGLSRVQVAFPHSILYGLFCSLALASVYYLFRRNLLRTALFMGLIIGMTLMSLSSAPMISVLLQTCMVVWDKITRGAWKLLAGMVACLYLFLQIFTNRGAVVIFIETLTLDPATGWWRIYIWKWGTQSVMAHPLLGIGLDDWVRPEWLTSSVDNFWLLMAMRHGLPALICILMAFLLHILFILRRRNLSEEARSLRTGYLITLVGLIFTLATVFVWDAMAVFVMFFLGAGAFLYAADPAPSEASPNPDALPARSQGPRFSRFAQTPGTDRRRPPKDSLPR